MNVLALIASGAAVLASAPVVLGHGYIVDPAATWAQGYASNGWGSSIDNNMFGSWDYSEYSSTVEFFEAAFNASGYESLGQFILTNQVMYSDDVDPDCGLTIYDDSSRSTMPESELTYTGFTHPGPCEVWCDDNKVLFDYDCQTAYPEGTMAYDASLCADANRFTIYWLGVHGSPWQVFTDCVWLEGGSGSGSAPSPATEEVASGVVTAPPTASGSGSTLTATTTTTTTAPTATTATPTATTAAPTATTETTTAPTATTAAPTATTAAPTATTTEAPAATEKCTARRN